MPFGICPLLNGDNMIRLFVEHFISAGIIALFAALVYNDEAAVVGVFIGYAGFMAAAQVRSNLKRNL